jgi:hypothetical protein
MRKIHFDPKELQDSMNTLKTSEKVAEKYNCHKETILRKARDMGLKWPENQTNIDHKFFNNWSRRMAYITGFITGDGCIHNKRPYLMIELKKSDRCVIEYIRDSIKPEAKIYDRNRHNDEFSWSSSRLVLFSQPIINSLKQYSIFPNKTGKHKLDFDIPEKYIWDYVRGFFDADGSVFYRHGLINSKLVCKSKDFIYSIHDLIENLGTINCHKGLYSIAICYKESLILGQKMYRDEEFCLQRKKDRFMNPRL